MNASRAKRAMMSHYQTYYEERAKSLDSIIEKFKQQTTFEEFVGSVYNPNGGSSCIIGGGSIASVTRSDLSASLVTQDTWTSDTEPRPRAHTGLDSESSGGFRSGQFRLKNCIVYPTACLFSVSDVNNKYLQDNQLRMVTVVS